jgi:hypothetical protein
MGWPIGQPMNSNHILSNRTSLSCPTTGHFYFALTHFQKALYSFLFSPYNLASLLMRRNEVEGTAS